MTGKRFLIPLAVILTASGQDLVRVPARGYEVTDQITSLKLRISVSEFLMGTTEVTQRQYREITSSNPSVYAGDTRPVENVSWWDAIRYCNLRSAKEGLPTCYNLVTGEEGWAAPDIVCQRKRNGSWRRALCRELPLLLPQRTWVCRVLSPSMFLVPQ